jgi:hypothetical protein
MRKATEPKVFAVFAITGAATDEGNYDQIVITKVLVSGTFNNGDLVDLVFIRAGDVGPTGSEGASTWTPVTDSSIKRLSGSNWEKVTAVEGDATLRSAEGYARGCYVSWKTGTNTKGYGIGLNTDPASSENFESIDYWLNCSAGGAILIREGGSLKAEPGAYAVGDTFTITYDGHNVRYYRTTSAGVTTMLREVARPQGEPLYMDSWWNQEGGKAENLVFGPMAESGRQPGFRYYYSTATEETDPGSGKVKFNNTAEPWKAVDMRISETDADGGEMEKWLLSLDDTNNASWEGHVVMRKAGAPGTYMTSLISPTGYTDKGAWGVLHISEAIAHVGTFADGDEVYFEFYERGDRGEKGEKGETGPEGTGASMWRDVFQASTTVPSATAAGNHMMGYTTSIPVATNTSVPVHQQFIKPTDYFVTGKKTMFRLRFALEVNGTAPGVAFWKVQLYKLTAAAGAAAGITRTLVAKGSATAELNSPTKETPGSAKESVEFELTEEGVYLPIITITGAAVAAASVVGIHCRLQVRNV